MKAERFKLKINGHWVKTFHTDEAHLTDDEAEARIFEGEYKDDILVHVARLYPTGIFYAGKELFFESEDDLDQIGTLRSIEYIEV